MKRKNVAIMFSVMLAFSGVSVPEKTVCAQETLVTQEDQYEEQDNWAEEDGILSGSSQDADYDDQEWLLDDGYGVDDSFLEDDFLIDPEEDEELTGTEDLDNDKNSESLSGTSQNADGQVTTQNEDETTVQTGSCGENATYDLDSKGKLRIKGSGAVTHITAFKENNQIRTVVVEEGITDIAPYAFSRCDSLVSVTLPDSMTAIREAMFIKCDNLSEVTLPKKLKVIGDNAFSGCMNLTSLTLPDTLTDIGVEAFSGVGITKFNLPQGVQRIGEGAFTSDIFTEIQLPETITDLGARAFQYCEKLKKITIPENVSEIRDGTFLACSALKTVTLPQNLQRIGKDAFSNCKALTEVDISASVTEIGKYAFYKCDKLNTVYIRGNEVSIGECAIGYSIVYVKAEEEWKDVKNKNLIFYGNIGSTAEKYAAENELTFPHPAEVLVHCPPKEETCEENGNIEYWHCNSCGLNYSDKDGKETVADVVISKNGHEIKLQSGKDATTESEGRKEYYFCSRCGKKFWKENGTEEVTDDRDLVISKIKITEETEGVVETEPEQITPETTAAKDNLIQTEKKHRKQEKNTGTKKETTQKTQKVRTKKIKGLKKSISIVKGKTMKLKPVLVPKNSTEKISYSTSNKKVAAVNAKGVITGKKAGTAKITVKSGSKKYVITVKVTKVKTAKLSGIPAKKSIKKGKTYKLKAVVTPKNSDEKVTYSSSNKKIATVTAKGVVKGKKKGTVKITVKSGSRKKTCKVTVK